MFPTGLFVEKENNSREMFLVYNWSALLSELTRQSLHCCHFKPFCQKNLA